MAKDVKIKISAQNDTDRGFNQAELNFKSLQKEAKQMGAAIGVAFAAAAAASVYLVKASIDAMDEMSKLAQQTGTTVESLSALSFAADLSGVSNAELGSALVKLTKNMSDAAAGTGIAVEGFSALGISVKNSDGSLKASDAVLTEIAEKFAGFKDGAEKTALAVNLFGRSGAQLIPLLNSGADGLQEMKEEAQKLGLILETKTSKAAEEFNDNLTRIEASAKGLANTITAALLPALNSSLNGLTGLPSKINLLGLANDVIAAEKSLKSLEGRRGSIFNFAGNLELEIAKASSRLAAAKEEFNSADTNRPSLIGSVATKTDTNKPSAPVIAAAGAAGKDPDADFKRFMDNLQKQIEKTQDLSATEQLLADIQQGRLTVSPAQQAKLQALANELDLIKQTASASEERMKMGRDLAMQEGDAVNKANQAYQARLKTLLDDTPSAVLEKQRADVALLTDEYQRFIDTAGAAGINQEQYLQAVTSRLDLVAEKTKKAKDFAEELGLTFSSAFEDAIVNGKGLRDVLDGIGKDIARIIVRKQVTEPFANGFGKIASSGGDFFSNLFSKFSFAGGGSTGNGPRIGGVDGQGGFPAILHPQERVIDLARGQSAGGGVTIIQNINIDSRSDRASIMAAMRTAADLAKAEILRSSRAGGVFA